MGEDGPKNQGTPPQQRGQTDTNLTFCTATNGKIGAAQVAIRFRPGRVSVGWLDHEARLLPGERGPDRQMGTGKRRGGEGIAAAVATEGRVSATISVRFAPDRPTGRGAGTHNRRPTRRVSGGLRSPEEPQAQAAPAEARREPGGAEARSSAGSAPGRPAPCPCP